MNWDLVLSVLLDGIFGDSGYWFCRDFQSPEESDSYFGFVGCRGPRSSILPVESHGLGFNPLHVMCLVYDRFVQYLFCPVDSLPGRGFFFPFIATHDSRNVCLQDNLGIDPFHENGG